MNDEKEVRIYGILIYNNFLIFRIKFDYNLI